MTGRRTTPRIRERRRPPALVTDLPVLAVLVACSATVAVFWAHVITGLVLIVLVGVHLSTRRRRLLRRRRARHQLPYGAFLVVATAAAATGLLRWAGVAPQHVWHGGLSYLVLGMATVHLWSIRRALRARLRQRRARGRQSRKDSRVRTELTPRATNAFPASPLVTIVADGSDR